MCRCCELRDDDVSCRLCACACLCVCVCVLFFCAVCAPFCATTTTIVVGVLVRSKYPLRLFGPHTAAITITITIATATVRRSSHSYPYNKGTTSYTPKLFSPPAPPPTPTPPTLPTPTQANANATKRPYIQNILIVRTHTTAFLCCTRSYIHTYRTYVPTYVRTYVRKTPPQRR